MKLLCSHMDFRILFYLRSVDGVKTANLVRNEEIMKHEIDNNLGMLVMFSYKFVLRYKGYSITNHSDSSPDSHFNLSYKLVTVSFL